MLEEITNNILYHSAFKDNKICFEEVVYQLGATISKSKNFRINTCKLFIAVGLKNTSYGFCISHMAFFFSSLTFFPFHEFTDRVHNIFVIFSFVRRGHHCLSIFHIIFISIKPHFLLILQGSCIPSVSMVSQNGTHAAEQ